MARNSHSFHSPPVRTPLGAVAPVATTAAPSNKKKLSADERKQQLINVAVLILILGTALPVLFPLYVYISNYLYPPQITYINLETETARQQLSHVFFSGQPYLLYCNDRDKEKDKEGQALLNRIAEHHGRYSSHPSSSLSHLSNFISLAVVNCSHPLPSQHNIFSRWKLTPIQTSDTYAVPTIIWTHSLNRPTVLSANTLTPLMSSSSPTTAINTLFTHLHTQSMPTLTRITSSSMLSSHCLSYPLCALLLLLPSSSVSSFSVELNVLSNLQFKRRDVHFVVLNGTEYFMDLESKLPSVDDHVRFIVFKSSSRVRSRMSDTKVKVIRLPFSESTGETFLSQFSTHNSNETQEERVKMAGLPRVPTISRRRDIKRNTKADSKREAETSTRKSRAAQSPKPDQKKKKQPLESSLPSSSSTSPPPSSSSAQREQRRREQMEKEGRVFEDVEDWEEQEKEEKEEETGSDSDTEDLSGIESIDLDSYEYDGF